jgi:hypothetical protein
MSALQRILLLVGAVIASGVFLRPPYLWEQTTYLVNQDDKVLHTAGTQIAPAGHHWIWAPPQGRTESQIAHYGGNFYSGKTDHVARIDRERTGVYAGLPIALFAFAAFAVRGPKK